MSLHFSEMAQLQQLMTRFGQGGQAPIQQFTGPRRVPGRVHGQPGQIAPQGLSLAAPPQGQVPGGGFQPMPILNQAPLTHPSAPQGQGGLVGAGGVTLRPEGFVRPPVPVGTTPGSPGFVSPQDFAQAQQGFIPQTAILRDAMGQQFGQEQGARSPEASADLSNQLANIKQLLSKQQKQFSAFGKQQGQFGKQFGQFVPRAGGLRKSLANNLGREDEQRAVPGQGVNRANENRAANQRIVNQRQSQEVRRPTRGQVAGARQKDIAQLKQAQAKQPRRRRRVGQGVRAGLARLKGRFNKR